MAGTVVLLRVAAIVTRAARVEWVQTCARRRWSSESRGTILKHSLRSGRSHPIRVRLPTRWSRLTDPFGTAHGTPRKTSTRARLTANSSTRSPVESQRRSLSAIEEGRFVRSRPNHGEVAEGRESFHTRRAPAPLASQSRAWQDGTDFRRMATVPAGTHPASMTGSFFVWQTEVPSEWLTPDRNPGVVRGMGRP